MLSFRRTAVVTALTGVGTLGVVTPALADPGFGTVDCSQTPSPACDLGAGTGGSPGKPGGATEQGNADSDRPGPSNGNGGDQGGSNLASCGYRPSGFQPPPGAAGSGAVSGGGLWLDGVCSASGAIQTPEFVPALTPAEVARLARSQLRLPAPAIAANPAGDQLVNLPTWLWLSGGWVPVSATASVPGVSVTAVARPTSVSWEMGDGATVTCTGAGTPYRAGIDPKSPSPDCGHTYQRSSASQAGQAFPVSATMRWTVTWSGAGQSGTFPNMTTTGSAAFRVAESQALNNGGG